MTTIDSTDLDAITGGQPTAPEPGIPKNTGRPAGTTNASPPLTVDVLRKFCDGLEGQSRRAEQKGDPAAANALERAANACFLALP